MRQATCLGDDSEHNTKWYYFLFFPIVFVGVKVLTKIGIYDNILCRMKVIDERLNTTIWLAKTVYGGQMSYNRKPIRDGGSIMSQSTCPECGAATQAGFCTSSSCKHYTEKVPAKKSSAAGQSSSGGFSGAGASPQVKTQAKKQPRSKRQANASVGTSTSPSSSSAPVQNTAAHTNTSRSAAGQGAMRQNKPQAPPRQERQERRADNRHQRAPGLSLQAFDQAAEKIVQLDLTTCTIDELEACARLVQLIRNDARIVGHTSEIDLQVAIGALTGEGLKYNRRQVNARLKRDGREATPENQEETGMIKTQVDETVALLQGVDPEAVSLRKLLAYRKHAFLLKDDPSFSGLDPEAKEAVWQFTDKESWQLLREEVENRGKKASEPQPQKTEEDMDQKKELERRKIQFEDAVDDFDAVKNRFGADDMTIEAAQQRKELAEDILSVHRDFVSSPDFSRSKRAEIRAASRGDEVEALKRKLAKEAEKVEKEAEEAAADAKRNELKVQRDTYLGSFDSADARTRQGAEVRKACAEGLHNLLGASYYEEQMLTMPKRLELERARNGAEIEELKRIEEEQKKHKDLKDKKQGKYLLSFGLLGLTGMVVLLFVAVGAGLVFIAAAGFVIWASRLVLEEGKRLVHALLVVLSMFTTIGGGTLLYNNSGGPSAIRGVTQLASKRSGSHAPVVRRPEPPSPGFVRKAIPPTPPTTQRAPALRKEVRKAAISKEVGCKKAIERAGGAKASKLLYRLLGCEKNGLMVKVPPMHFVTVRVSRGGILAVKKNYRFKQPNVWGDGDTSPDYRFKDESMDGVVFFVDGKSIGSFEEPKGSMIVKWHFNRTPKEQSLTIVQNALKETRHLYGRKNEEPYVLLLKVRVRPIKKATKK